MLFLFNKNLNIKIYAVNDSNFTELVMFKLDCSKVTLRLYDKYYHITFHRYNGERSEVRPYLLNVYLK